ncbi:MAG: lactate utilization protein [Desulfobacteraceae bacterium]|nr:lactate utilization protein [Desulfobacteraceae bacterium]
MTNAQHHTWLWEKLGHQTIENLKKHGFTGHFLASADEAREFAAELAKDYNSFGFGGSATARALDLPEALKQQGKTVYDHWDPQPEESDLTLRLKQGRCDCFICSANAISATGEIINVDGVGNRTNAMTFGCPNVIIIAGMNKVTRDLDSALRRVKEVAGPLRARSLNMNTPCAETGICTDCNSPQRICRITTILHRKPMMTDVTVVLINQSLGF